MKNTSSLNYSDKTPKKGISWRAILAGTVATLAFMLILNLIGLSLGLLSIEPTEENNPLSGLGTGAIIWWVISNLVVLFIGGFVAARLGVSFENISGVIQGIMTWALYALISAWLVTSVVGSIISGVGSAVGGVLSTTGEAVQEELGPVIKEQFDDLEVSLDDAKEEFYSLLEDSGKEELDPEYLESRAERSAQDARNEVTGKRNQSGRADIDIERIFNKSTNRFEQSFEAIDKQALINILVERTNMNENEARRSVENTIAEFESAGEEFEEFLDETEEKAREKAESVAEAVGAASMYLAIALILGLLAAALGGFLGVKKMREDYSRNYPEDTAGYNQANL